MKIPLHQAIEIYKNSEVAIKQKLDETGWLSDWIKNVPTTNGPVDYFLKKGKTKPGAKCYLSECPHYNGYWLARLGAVDCRLVDNLLPGIIVDFTCSKNYKSCPIMQFYLSNITEQE